jgi:hypothetical protein
VKPLALVSSAGIRAEICTWSSTIGCYDSDMGLSRPKAKSRAEEDMLRRREIAEKLKQLKVDFYAREAKRRAR